MSTYNLIPIGGRKAHTLDEAIALAKKRAAGNPPPPLPPGGNAGQKDQHTEIEYNPVTIPPGLSIAKSPTGYIFNGLKYQNRDLDPIELSGSLLDNGAQKNYTDWLNYSQTNPSKWSVVDTEIIYQCLFSAYQLRNDAQHKAVVAEFAAFMQGLLGPSKPDLSTLTKLNYHDDNSLEATVSKTGTALGTVADKRILVPEFTKSDNNWSYLILSSERQESKLAKVSSIPSEAIPLLETMLGENYPQAGAVFSYFSSRKSSNLRESRLWTPAESNRNIGERLAVFGGGIGGGFDLGVSGGIVDRRPALGVRVVAPKK